MSVSEWNDCLGASIYFTRRLVYDFADSHDFILVIIHFDDENFGLWWDFFVGDFSRRAVYTFQRALVDLFVSLLVGVYPVLVFLPCIVVETCACEGGCAGGCAPQRRYTVRRMPNDAFGESRLCSIGCAFVLFFFNDYQAQFLMRVI